MYILARLNLNGQCISVAKEYADLKVGVDTKPFKAALDEEEGLRQVDQGRDDLPRRHARSLDPLLARRRRHRSRQGHRDHRGAAAADGGEHEGRHHGLLLRLRAVEPAAHPPEHRLHRDHHRRALEQASGEIARHARGLRRQESEGRQGPPDGGDGSAEWCEKPENRDEVAAICAKRQWINCPVEDVTDRVKGKFDYGIPGKVVENSPHIMRYWDDHASYPFQSHDLWFLTEDIRWGKFEVGSDTKALIGKVNREDLWREAAKELSVPADRDPDLEVARQGDLLRRQGLRSGKSDGLPQEPGDQARRDRLNDWAAAERSPPAARPSRNWSKTEMNMPVLKTETAVSFPTRRRRPRCWRSRRRRRRSRRARSRKPRRSRATSCRRSSCSRSSSVSGNCCAARPARRCRRRPACSRTPGN